MAALTRLRAAFREFVTHNGTARPPQFDYRDPRGPLHAPRHLRCELHLRLQSPQVTTEDCPKTLLRDQSVTGWPASPACTWMEQSAVAIGNLTPSQGRGAKERTWSTWSAVISLTRHSRAGGFGGNPFFPRGTRPCLLEPQPLPAARCEPGPPGLAPQPLTDQRIAPKHVLYCIFFS